MHIPIAPESFKKKADFIAENQHYIKHLIESEKSLFLIEAPVYLCIILAAVFLFRKKELHDEYPALLPFLLCSLIAICPFFVCWAIEIVKLFFFEDIFISEYIERFVK
jgi:hypothetical protein